MSIKDACSIGALIIAKLSKERVHPSSYRKWRAPNSLRDSNVNPKQRTTEEQGVGAHSLTRNTLEE
jgi:hypothetical protein